MIAQHKVAQREGATAEAQQAPGQQAGQGHHEHVQQGPARHPAAGGHVGPRRAEQAIAVGQVQVQVHAVEVLCPAGDGQATTGGIHAQAGGEVHLRIAQFHAAGFAGAAARDEQTLTIGLGALQAIGRGHVEAPAALHLSADAVLGVEARSGKIQPGLARQAQAIGFVGRQATRPFLHRQLIAVAQGEGRQGTPVVGHAGLGRIDRRCGAGAGDAQGGGAGVAPDLLGGPGRGCQARRDAGQRGGGACIERQRPRARLHLHVQLAVGIQARRQFALQRQGHETLRQHRAKGLLTRLSGDADLDPGGERGGHAVFEAAEHQQVECVSLGLRRLAAAQRELVAAALQRLHRPSIDPQGHQADRRRHAQLLRPLCPGNASANLHAARGQPDLRRVVVQQHGHRLAVHGHVLRPVLAVARQGHPVRRLHAPALAETCAVRLGVELQSPRPGADVGAARARRLGGEEGAGAVIEVVQHPAAPVAQGGGDGGIIAALGQCEGSGQQQQQRDQDTGHGHSGGRETGGTRRRAARGCAQCSSRRTACSPQASTNPMRKNR